MAELIADLPYRIVAANGQEFFASVAATQRHDGTWQGWLEFVPLSDAEPLVTPTETTQSNRAALEHWASALEETYVQGAFQRAVPIADARLTGGPAARRILPEATPLNDVDVPDPFRLYDSGREAMRTRLNALPRRILLHIISSYGLDPAAKDVSWLTDRQLVTFIVTAVEAQRAMGRG